MVEMLTNPHDRSFRQVLSRQDVATDFLRHYLPPEAAALEIIYDSILVAEKPDDLRRLYAEDQP